ncbi:helix-turn-helix domain-containing protein [Desertibaculum subflavum]|uniref:helix-turn-helix domain-containing protein n=1 Tax=Desertibaculum subflavum TaxID=2268458 RepID=UPI000E66AE7F
MKQLATAASRPIPPALRGISARLHHFPGGRVELAASPFDLISIHVGQPVRVTCHGDSLVHRRLQAQGDIDIVPAGTAGYWEDDGPASALVLRLPHDFLRVAANDMGLDPARAALARRMQIRDARIESFGWNLKAELEARRPGHRLYAESLCQALAVHLLRHHAKGKAAVVVRAGLTRRQLARVLRLIETEMDRELPLARLAKAAGLGLSQFKALFKQSVGLTPHQYLLRRRVEQARHLLEAERMPIAEAAAATGFAHQSHLARNMRRLIGVTPRQLIG